MIAIADSGSTKCDWILIDANGSSTPTHTMGFNPMFHSAELIETELGKNELLKKNSAEVTDVFFYCAGGSSDELRGIVRTALNRFFSHATADVHHDLDGSVFATCGTQPGIVCILGTGSNSCFFDGKELYEEIPSLGYILGDEGSGSWFGRILLRHYLYKKMPPDIHDLFVSTFNTNKDEIFTHVYRQPNANVYLASFMRFVSDNRHHRYIQDMVDEGLYEFMNTHICCFKNYREVPVHFVGSIAFYFEEIIHKLAANLSIQVGIITNKPILGLAKYHTTQKGISWVG